MKTRPPGVSTGRRSATESAYARGEAKHRLSALDDELLGDKPTGWTVLGFRERTLVTRFRDVMVRRRMCRDDAGQTRYRLDEALMWKPYQQASPSLTESIVSMASVMPPYQVRGRLFRMVDEMVSDLTAGVLSPMMVHRLLSGDAQSAMDDEQSRWESCFARGEDVCDGDQQLDVLYTEADGVRVHQQREDRKHYEVKSALAYRGWRSVGENRYGLVRKRVYCHASDTIPFWEGASLEWGKQYALEHVKQFVVGGDGANWVLEAPRSLGHLDERCSNWTASTCPAPVAGAMAESSALQSMSPSGPERCRSLMH